MITGENQTGKTTLVSLIQTIIGYEYKEISETLNIESLNGKYLRLVVEDKKGEVKKI